MKDAMALDYHLALGHWLRRQRDRIGLSSRDAAKLLGISNGKLSNLETGKTESLTAANLSQICQKYQVDEATEWRLVQQHPMLAASSELDSLSHGKPEVLARLAPLMPELIGLMHWQLAIYTLVHRAYDGADAAGQWLREGKANADELFFEQCPELQRADELRNFLKAAHRSDSGSPVARRNIAAAIAILDTVWLADNILPDELVTAIRDACEQLVSPDELQGPYPPIDSLPEIDL